MTQRDRTYRQVKMRLPAYVLQELEARAREEGMTVGAKLLETFQAAGFEIDDTDIRRAHKYGRRVDKVQAINNALTKRLSELGYDISETNAGRQ